MLFEQFWSDAHSHHIQLQWTRIKMDKIRLQEAKENIRLMS